MIVVLLVFDPGVGIQKREDHGQAVLANEVDVCGSPGPFLEVEPVTNINEMDTIIIN